MFGGCTHRRFSGANINCLDTLHRKSAHEEAGWGAAPPGPTPPGLGDPYRTLKIEPDSYVIHTALGESYYNIGLLDNSIHELQTAIRINPEGSEAHFLLGFTYGEKTGSGQTRLH